MDLLGVFGFLESSRDGHSNHELEVSTPVFPSEKLVPTFGTSLQRDFETGEFQNLLDDLTLSEQFRCKTAKDIPLEVVENRLSELNKYVRVKFHMDTLDFPDVGSERDFAAWDPCDRLLSPMGDDSAQASSLSLAPLKLESALCSGINSKRLKVDFTTQRKYAIVEDTSEKLPKFSNLIKDPAFTWPFELDTFQKQAILCLERNQSVFVAAHTSAGKTVIAEYASAMCRRRGSRVIYTSPIKALSNQKFHDFRRTFGDDVGLLTGDIKVATDSSLLVMTTEILYNMLCNAADAIRDLEIVIMDEVHYLNDAERGHVWEQIMIMLPKHVLLVMLSATVPNTVEFADWLGRIRDSEIHVVATDRRPVPLEHYLYTGLNAKAGGNQLHLVVDQNRCFNLPGYRQAITAFTASKSKKPGDKESTDTSRAEELKAMGRGTQKQRGGQSKSTGGKFNTPGRNNFMPAPGSLNVHEKRTKNLWFGVVRLLQERELMPAIAFGFSRNSLEVLAEHLSSVDLLNHNEKNEVQQFLRYSIKNHLKGPDAHLPSVLFITELVSRGIAVHHAGMLPLLKETVEMLFQRGLVRLLFATETFAMGVNMPARCVIFTTLEKFDGRGRRALNPGEYTQMAGRAGRRGLDASGTVIIMIEGIGQAVAPIKTGVPTQETLTRMILGVPSRLVSQFKITYSMILHLHRTNWLSPQDIMRRSFMEANALRRETDRRQCLTRLQARLASTTILIPSAGAAASTSVPIFNKSIGVLGNSNPLVPVGEPILQVKCPLGQSDCVDMMTTYYQACSKLQQLTTSVAAALANQSTSELQRVFCPGRLIFIKTSAKDTRKSISVDKFPSWIVPAMIVDIVKTCVNGITEVQWSLITWQVPDKPPYFSTSGRSGIPALDDTEAEEEVLRDGEEMWMTQTPYPPQLMPVFIPASLDDALARLVLLPDQDARTLVRLCDHTVDFKAHGPSTKSSSALIELLKRAMIRHRQELLASEAGLRLVGASTSAADSELPQMVSEVNRNLFGLVEPLVSGSPSETSNVFYGLPSEFPVPLHIGRAVRAKANADEHPQAATLFDELWMLSEELTTPLLDTHVTQRLAPITCPDLVAHLALAHRTCRRRWAVKRLEQSLSRDKLQLNTEYTGRLRVLEELGFIDSATERGCLSLKGLVACELQQMEVLLTQLLLDGSFTQLPPADIAALLSCFVFEMRASDVAREEQKAANQVVERKQAPHVVVLDGAPTHEAPESVEKQLGSQKLASVPEHLQATVLKMFEFANKLEELQYKHGLIDPTSDTRLNYSLVRVTHAWATGHPFATTVQLTDMPEGQLVRGLLRLDELIRHICNACHRLGDQALGVRMNEARQAIHRDLICAPSLYISDDFNPETSS